MAVVRRLWVPGVVLAALLLLALWPAWAVIYYPDPAFQRYANPPQGQPPYDAGDPPQIHMKATGYTSWCPNWYTLLYVPKGGTAEFHCHGYDYDTECSGARVSDVPLRVVWYFGEGNTVESQTSGETCGTVSHQYNSVGWFVATPAYWGTGAAANPVKADLDDSPAPSYADDNEANMGVRAHQAADVLVFDMEITDYREAVPYHGTGFVAYNLLPQDFTNEEPHEWGEVRFRVWDLHVSPPAIIFQTQYRPNLPGNGHTCQWDGKNSQGQYVACGPYQYQVTQYSDRGSSVTQSRNFWVVNMDLAVQGTTEETEESVGGYVPFNGDDDDQNLKEDTNDPGPMGAPDDDMLEITLYGDTVDSVTLSATSGPSCIAVWSTTTKQQGTQITLPATFPAGQLPKTLYVEGKQVSGERGIVLRLEGNKNGKVGMTDLANLTVFMPDLDIDGVVDAQEYETGAPLALGARRQIRIENCVPAAGGTVTLGLERESVTGAASVWTAWTGGTQVTLPHQYTAPQGEDPPIELWVQGDQTGEYVLKLEYTRGVKTAKDLVRFLPGAVDLDIEGVTDADEENPGGFVSLNDDDDNANTTPDKEETGPVSSENGLVKVVLQEVPSPWTGAVRLEKVGSAGKIKIWTTAIKGTEVVFSGTPPAVEFAATELPKELWVEGYESSDGPRDVGLRLSFGGCSDDVSFTVVDDNTTPSIPAYLLRPHPFDPLTAEPESYAISTSLDYQVTDDFSTTVFVTIRVTSGGQTVRTLASHEAVNTGPEADPDWHSAPWDGMNDNGQLLPYGVYWVSLDVEDEAGNQSSDTDFVEMQLMPDPPE